MAGRRKGEEEKASVGKWGEEEAARYLKKNGYRVKDRNVRFARLGEIDIVAEKGRTIVFVEVKTRRSTHYGLPEEAMTSRKAKHFLNMAKLYLKRSKKQYNKVRLDVIALEKQGDRWDLRHIQNALTDG